MKSLRIMDSLNYCTCIGHQSCGSHRTDPRDHTHDQSAEKPSASFILLFKDFITTEACQCHEDHPHEHECSGDQDHPSRRGIQIGSLLEPSAAFKDHGYDHPQGRTIYPNSMPGNQVCSNLNFFIVKRARHAAAARWSLCDRVIGWQCPCNKICFSRAGSEQWLHDIDGSCSNQQTQQYEPPVIQG